MSNPGLIERARQMLSAANQRSTTKSDEPAKYQEIESKVIEDKERGSPPDLDGDRS